MTLHLKNDTRKIIATCNTPTECHPGLVPGSIFFKRIYRKFTARRRQP